MVTRDPRIDAYLDQAPEFARAILAELRKRMHAACPDVVETIKWRHPSFEYHGLLGGMAAFKQHCAFGFWRHDLLAKEHPEFRSALAACGCLKTAADLPPMPMFRKLVAKAMEWNAKVARVPKRARPAIAMHPGFAQALAASKAAKRQFEAFAPSHRRDCLEWIADAKRDDTRHKRIEQAIEWIAEGKHRNWKYERC
jgi:uncharacterized protein YdeI (YjbR/CyaY-like superfamily)